MYNSHQQAYLGSRSRCTSGESRMDYLGSRKQPVALGEGRKREGRCTSAQLAGEDLGLGFQRVAVGGVALLAQMSSPSVQEGRKHACFVPLHPQHLVPHAYLISIIRMNKGMKEGQQGPYRLCLPSISLNPHVKQGEHQVCLFCQMHLPQSSHHY